MTKTLAKIWLALMAVALCYAGIQVPSLGVFLATFTAILMTVWALVEILVH